MSDNQRQQEFESLTKKHVGEMWRTAFRMVGHRDTADDIVQEACLRAYRAFDEYESGTNYKAWIFRILTNLCRDDQRREYRAPFKEWNDEEVDRVTCNYYCQPDAELQSNEFAVARHEAMSRLPPKIRVVVSLSLIGEFDYNQIAQLLDIPVGTVRSRLSRGRMRLQRELFEFNAEHGHSEDTKVIQKENKVVAKSTANVLQIYPKPVKQKC